VYLGELALAQPAFDQVRRLGEALGDRRLQSYAAWNTGRVCMVQRDHAAAIAVCQHALALATDPHTRFNALFILGYAYVEQGDAMQAIPALEQAVQLCDHMQFRALKGSIMAHLGRAHLLRGDFAQALDLARQGLALARAAQYTAGIIGALKSLGRIALARGTVAGAETHFQDLRQLFTATEGRHGLGLFYLDLARLAHAQGNQEAVATHLH
jgi:tetratricopeptide (TPR) repeat protein